jgi:type III restriction enzyme
VLTVSALKLDLKVLTLFFVDRVSDYDGRDAPLPALFDECYQSVCTDKSYSQFRREFPSAERLHYFAQNARGQSRDTFNREADAEFERRAYELIMQKKEVLLDPREPGSFIFSHSALAEGWDNPNVFQICFIRRTASVTRRRQQIGRGLRIPVDSSGARVFDENVRKLTLVVNESYDSFVNGLNAEYDDALASKKQSDRTKVYRDGAELTIRRNSRVVESTDFQRMWADVNRAATQDFSVAVEPLIGEFCRDGWDEFAPMRALRNIVHQVEVSQDAARQYHVVHPEETRAFRGERPATPRIYIDLLGELDELLGQGENPIALSRQTVKALLSSIPEREWDGLGIHPESWMRLVAERIRVAFARAILPTTHYSLLPGTAFDLDTVFPQTVPSVDYDEVAKRGAVATQREGALYSHAICDSQVEHDYLRDCLMTNDGVQCFAKLPKSFRIPTPIGHYTPDWLMRYRDRTLVRETKGSLSPSSRRDFENVKIEFARRFFEQLGSARFSVETNDPATFLADQE